MTAPRRGRFRRGGCKRGKVQAEDYGPRYSGCTAWADLRPLLRLAYFLVMFIGLLLSWQRPECSRDLRFE